MGPAQAIECDMKSWYELNYTSGWAADAAIPPSSITGMTLPHWLEFVYANNISPQNHKVIGHIQGHHSYHYPDLRNVYLVYFNWNVPAQLSNQLTFAKMDRFIELINRHFYDYILKLIPATTIIDGAGVTYRNTLFNRQKFVYPPGINDGSEFQIKTPLNADLTINSTIVNSSVNDIFNLNIDTTTIVAQIAEAFEQDINTIEVSMSYSNGYNLSVNAVNTSMAFNSTQSKIDFVLPALENAIISMFPTQGIPQPAIPYFPTIYRTRDASDVATSVD